MEERTPPPSDGADDHARDPGDVVVHRDWSSGDSPSSAVVEAVAATTGAEPPEMSLLYDVIDPEALDRLVNRASHGPQGSGELTVSFTYEGCRVDVTSTGRVAVSVRDDRSR